LLDRRYSFPIWISFGLDFILSRLAFCIKKWWVGTRFRLKWRIPIEPAILSKVIPPFETKLGAGRHYLRWTTRQSQVQYFEKLAEVD
jgi:hypothetical protein